MPSAERRARTDLVTSPMIARLERYGARLSWVVVASIGAMLLMRPAAWAQPAGRAAAMQQAASLDAEAETLRSARKLDEAITLSERALAIREKALGKDHPDVARTLNSLGLLWRDRGDFARAELLLQRALTINEKALGSEHPYVAIALGNLGTLCRTRGAYDRAEPLLERALAIHEKTVGSSHPHVAIALNELALLHQAKGDYGRAEPLFERALGIDEANHGKEHPEVATALNNLATICRIRGDHARAEPLYQRALAIREKALGPDHPLVAISLNNLGWLYVETGDYGRAEPLLERALAVGEKAFGKDHPEIAPTLNNLGGVYWAKGDYDRAAPLFERALAIKERAFGPDHPEVAAALDSLGALYLAEGDTARAEKAMARALAIGEKSLGSDHPDVARSLYQLGALYRDRRDYDRAEPLFVRAIAIWEKTLGKDHEYVATLLHELGVLHLAKGVYDRAEPLFVRGLAIRERTLGKQHPAVAFSLYDLAELHWAQGDPERAVETQRRGNELGEQVLDAILSTGAEEQRQAYFATVADETERTVSLQTGAARAVPQAVRLALTTVLRRKGRVLDSMTETVRWLRASADEATVAELERWSGLRRELATRLLRGPSAKESAAEHEAAMTRLREQARALEQALGRRHAALRTATEPVTIEAVQSMLGEGSVLVELAGYMPYDPRSREWGSPRYVAYVLHHQGEPSWADLGAAAPIDELIGRVRSALATGDAGYAELGRALDERVMRPIRALLGASRDVLVAPDGMLSLVPFAALVDEQDRFLVSQYRFTYLTSGRDLLRVRHGTRPRSGPLVVANPAFGEPANREPPRATEDEASPRPRAKQMLEFPPLPGTAVEAEALRALLPEAQVVAGAEATEAVLRAARGPRILHIATHGFFLEDAPAPSPPERASTSRGAVLETITAAPEDQNAAGPDAESPLLRSGLALAGANRGVSGDDDGILTASEAGHLDLHGTKLVVLSACETALGGVRNGEGVYGLRRALVVAGAETALMSLWKVPDDETARLMTAYYQRIGRGESRSEALRQVQLELLADQPTSHPYFWAGFILAGDERGLGGEPAPPVDASTIGSDASKLLKVAPRAGGCACIIGGRGDRSGRGVLGVVAGLLLVARRRRSRGQQA